MRFAQRAGARGAARAVAAGSVLAALLAVSGCGVQSTAINVYAAAPISATTAGPSPGQTTTPAGQYPYWVYMLQSDNTPVPVERMASSQPTLQYVVDSLVRHPAEAGLFNATDAITTSITVSPGDQGQQYYLDFPYTALAGPARWQLLCTVWQWAQSHRPANSTRTYSIDFLSKSGDSGWHDCNEYTSTFPPGTKVPTPGPTSAPQKPTVGSSGLAGLPSASANSTLSTFSG